MFLMFRRPPKTTRTDTLFPYPTVFRSHAIARAKVEFHRIQARRTLGDFSAEPVDPLFANRSHTRKTESAGAGEPLSVVYAICLRTGGQRRSEEHTSELQSLMRISYAVFCLKQNQ